MDQSFSSVMASVSAASRASVSDVASLRRFAMRALTRLASPASSTLSLASRSIDAAVFEATSSAMS